MDKGSFIEGFVKQAVALGYDDTDIVSLFKLAMNDPQAGQMFHSMNQPQQPMQQPAQMTQPMSHPGIPALRQMLTNPQQAAQLHQLLGF